MKSNPLGALLLTGLSLCSVLSVGLVIYYLTTVRELERLRGQTTRMSSTMTILQAMATDTLSYSRTNAAVDSILFQYGLKPRPAAPAAPAAPATLPVPAPTRTTH